MNIQETASVCIPIPSMVNEDRWETFQDHVVVLMNKLLDYFYHNVCNVVPDWVK